MQITPTDLRVVLTGAAGHLGRKLRRHLDRRGGFEIVPLDRSGEYGSIRADLGVYDESWARHVREADVVVHLAGEPRPTADWRLLEPSNVDATLNVYMAVAGGSARVVFASSSLVLAGYRGDAPRLTPDLPARPELPYAISKAVGERIAKAFFDRYGVSTICLRIGYVAAGENPPPRGAARWLHEIWLSNRDLCQVMERAIRTEGVGFAVLNAMSKNAGMRWDLSETRRVLGFEPRDSSVPVDPSVRVRALDLARTRMGLRGVSLVRAGPEWLRARRMMRQIAALDVPEAELGGAARRLERILSENIAPFWLSRAVDEQGGYRLHHDARGEWKGPGPKRAVSQARTLWYFARMARAGYGADHLDAARHGFEFLCDRLWDEVHGGFFWEVDAAGEPALPDKHLYAQIFGLFGLTEYARATGDERAVTMAARVFDLLERKHHDSRHGGYHEFFQRDWSPASTIGAGYLRAPPGAKLMNTHLHVLEALIAYATLSNGELVRERVLELLRILSSAVVRKRHAACTEVHRADWSPVIGWRTNVSYGHNLENAVQLIGGCEMLSWPQEPFLDLYESLFETALTRGWDRRRGGFYMTGLLGLPAHRRQKIWWVQAESLLACAHLYRWTGRARYARIFLDTLRWIEEHQVDWEIGEWHEIVSSSGRPSGDKAGIWKDPYHQARSMLDAREIALALG